MELSRKPAQAADGTPAFQVQLVATKNGGPTNTLDADAVMATCLYYDNQSKNYKPVQNAIVTFSGPDSLFFFPIEGKTDQNGQVTSTVSCDYPGNYQITANAVAGTPHMVHTPSGPITIEFTDKPGDVSALMLDLTVITPPSFKGVPGMKSLQAYCYMGTGTPGAPKVAVRGAWVSLECDDKNLVFCAPSGTTHADGTYATDFGVYVDGTYTITATCFAGDSGTAQGQIQTALQIVYGIDIDYRLLHFGEYPFGETTALINTTLRILPDKPLQDELMTMGCDRGSISPDQGKTDASGTLSWLYTGTWAGYGGSGDYMPVTIVANAGRPIYAFNQRLIVLSAE